MAEGSSKFSMEQLKDDLVTVATDVQELAGAFCPRIKSPSPLEFLRDYVHPNRPCVITDAMESWPAMRKWDDDYLCEKFGERKISINVTPNGRGDAVKDGFFVMPEERSMTLRNFVSAMEASRSDEGKINSSKEGTNQGSNGKKGAEANEVDETTPGDVFYLSHQNDNLRTQLESLLIGDVPESIAFVDEALGLKPEAVNLWMGDERALTTCHKDCFENLYGVVRGVKYFTLFPPTSSPLLYPRPYYPRVYSSRTGKWTVEKVGEDCVSPEDTPSPPDHEPHPTRPWISVDPTAPDLDRFPLYAHARPVRVAVSTGELLYLPAMWYHQVGQGRGTVAVNYWYDMVFDARYVTQSMVERLSRHVHSEASEHAEAAR